MKQLKLLTAAILGSALIFLLMSCASLNPANKYPNMVANVDPFPVGTAEVQFDRFFSSKVNKVAIKTVFHPRLNAVSLEFRFELMTYRQFWDESARKQFAASLELYKRDFEDKKLVDDYRKTKAVYGNVKGRLVWEASKYTTTRVSNPTIEIGYRFKEKTPFFTTLMRSAREVVNEGENSNPMNSQQINMYFTRTQADEMVKIFDQASLLELLGMKGRAESGESDDSVPVDPYHEYGEP
jgi:hypothetical protein